MATYYVDKNLPGASDGNPGSEALPWLTIQHALDTVAPNDTVYVKAGTYTPTALTMITAGTSGNLITISAYSTDKVIIDFSSGTGTGWNWNGYKNYITVNGFEIRNAKGKGILAKGDYLQLTNNIVHDCGVINKTNAFTLEGGSNCTISGNEVYNSGGHGIYIENRSTDGAAGDANNNIISSNKLHNNLYGSGLYIVPNAAMTQNLISGTTIKFNKIYANAYNGIYTRKLDTSDIFSNLIYDNLSHGIEFGWRTVADGTHTCDSYLINNTIVFNDINIYNLAADAITFRNNILAYATTYAIYFGSYVAPFDLNYNLYYTEQEFLFSLQDDTEIYATLRDFSDRYGVERQGIESIPYFYNLSQDDYRLSISSPAVDSGETQTAIYEKDIRDITRPLGNAWDMGAYEYIFPAVGDYYVDNAATSGNNTGLSWINAWKSFSNIQWSLIQPGSTLHISGGVTSKTYSLVGQLSVTASGIIIQKSVDSGHDGEVILDCDGFLGTPIVLSGMNGVTIDGISVINATPQTTIGGAIKFIDLTTPIVQNCNVEVKKGCAVEYTNVVSGLVDSVTQTTVNYSSSNTNLVSISGGYGNVVQDCTATISNTYDTANIDVIYVVNETNPTIQRNRIYLNTGTATLNKDGIYCENNQGIIKIYNNLVYTVGNASGAGISFITTSGLYTGISEIYNNTVYVAGSNSYAVKLEDTSGTADQESYVKNNIFYTTGSGYVAYYPTTFVSGINCDYNIYYNTVSGIIEHSASSDTFTTWNSAGYDLNGYNVAPDFDTDYKLQKTSVGIDDGYTLSEITTDIDNVLRPEGLQYDIGAYETRKGYYVDNNVEAAVYNGESWLTAWSSFSQIDWNLFVPGDTLYISGGKAGSSQVYYDQLLVTASGSAEYPIYIMPGLDAGYNGQVVIDGQNLTKSIGVQVNYQDNVVVSGLTFRNALGPEISVYNSDNVKILDCNVLFFGRAIDVRYGTDCVVSGCTLNSTPFIGAETDGIYSQDNLNCIIENNYVAVYNGHIDGKNDCIQLFRDSGTIVRNNYCVQDTDKLTNSRGIYGSSCSGDIYIYNNVVNMNDTVSTVIGYQNLEDGSADVYILNNTIFGTKIYNGILTSQVSDPKIQNNIIQSNLGSYVLSISDWVGTETNINYNLYYNTLNSNLINYEGTVTTFEDWQALTFDTNSYNNNPRFVNEINGNLQLQDISPAKDVGVALSGIFTYDINGVSRPYGSAWDIGAYEGPGYDITKPTVTKAEILNATAVKVYFSEELVTLDAEKVENYSILDTGEVGNPNPAVVTATYDGATKSVLLSTTTHEYSSFVVTVEKVRDLAGNSIDTTANTATYYYYYIDTTSPKLLSAELLSTTLVRLTFDEALNSVTAQNSKNYSITNRIVYTAIYNAQEYSVVLITDEHSYGTYTVTVSNVTDLAGNLIDANYDEATYDRIFIDMEGPRLLSAVANSDGNEVNVRFSESIISSGLEDIANYSISGLIISGLWNYGQWNDRVLLYTDAMTDGVTYTLVISSGLTDIAGNPIDPLYDTYSFKYTATPAILSVSGINANTLDIWFTHPMNTTTLEDLNSYNIAGPSTITAEKLVINSTDHITVGTSKPTASGLYTLSIDNAYDIYGLEMVAPDNEGTYEVIGDYTPPEVVSAELLSANSLKITFNEKLYAAVSQNPAQYTIQKLTVSGYLEVYSVYITDAYAYLTTAAHGYLQNYRVTVSGVEDLSGNVISGMNTADYTYNVSGLSLNITSPAGGETYYNGQYKPITWTLSEL